MKIKIISIIFCILFAYQQPTWAVSGKPYFLRAISLDESHRQTASPKDSGLASDANKELMISVLNILCNHKLLRQGVIPDLPPPLNTESWNDKEYFDLLPNENGERISVNANRIWRLKDKKFHEYATAIMNIIDGRIQEGALGGALSREEERVLMTWEKFIKKEGIRPPDAKPAEHGTIKTSVLPEGFRQAAETMSDVFFATFIDLLKREVYRVSYHVMRYEPSVVQQVKAILAQPQEKTFAHEGATSALCIRYDDRPLTAQEITEGKGHPPIVEEYSPIFGILAPDFIEILERDGLLQDYHRVASTREKKYSDNPYIIVEHLLKGEPIAQNSFSSPELYDKFIDDLIRYKLRTGELGLNILPDPEERQRVARVMQRNLNSTFGVEGGRNIFPLDCLMLLGKRQLDIHNKYGGQQIRGIVEYTDPLIHILNALRMLRTDRLTGARSILRTALLLHDIGKLDTRPEDMAESDHIPKGMKRLDGALYDMEKDGYRPVERIAVKLLVRTHAALGTVHLPKGTKESGIPDMSDVIAELIVPRELANILSPQALYLWHKRIYDADTSSIANISWLRLTDRLRKTPEMATPRQRSLALRRWGTEVRDRFIVSIDYYYRHRRAYDRDMRDVLLEMGINDESAKSFFNSIFKSPNFPGIFIHSHGEDFDIAPAVQLVGGIIRQTNPAATYSSRDIENCVSRYFVIRDWGVMPLRHIEKFHLAQNPALSAV